MAGIIEKSRVIVLSRVHGLLDKIIDLDSIGAVRQYVRDLENALEELQDSAAEAAGYERSVRREARDLDAKVTELNQNIDFILSDAKPENDHLATPLEARLIALEQQLASKKDEITAAEATAKALNEAASNLKAKHEHMVGQLQRLEAVDRATKAKEQASRAMKQAGRIAGTGADVSVDDVSARLQRRSDVADARFQRAMGDMTDQVEKDVVLAQAEARLAQRKARLGLGPGTAAPEKP